MAGNPQEPDPERHLKRLKLVFGVSGRIQKLSVRQHKSPTKISNDVLQKELLVKSKELRKARLNQLGAQHRYILDVVGECFDQECDEMINGMTDSDKYIELLNMFVSSKGPKCIMFFYDMFPHPPAGKCVIIQVRQKCFV